MPKRLALVAVVFVGLAPIVACTQQRSEASQMSTPTPVTELARVVHPTVTASTTTTTTTTEPPTTTTTAPPPTTTEPPAPEPERSGTVGAAATGGSVEDAVHQAFGSGSLFSSAWRVSDCESTHDPTAIGGDNYGLFQIAAVHADAFKDWTGVSFSDGWSDPYLNASYARHLYNESGGWGPWGCRWAA
jgi:hypothetical protein